RIIAATNRDMEALVNQGKIRLDFFYRIGVIPVQIPPLRERKEDIPLLMDHFMELQDFPSAYIPAKVVETFSTYDWPGNVRELLNSVKQYITLNTISFLKHSGGIAPDPSPIRAQRPLKEEVETFERELIQKALTTHQGKKKLAAQALGINRRTLFNKMKKYRIQ
ncbi:MAG: sigma 54-interacting transcriptional regulator, partial [Desulfobacterales bacterium]|nr:sigma 54-interacting transcriptional regulator [Desulfobacterales bacterium]